MQTNQLQAVLGVSGYVVQPVGGNTVGKENVSWAERVSPPGLFGGGGWCPKGLSGQAGVRTSTKAWPPPASPVQRPLQAGNEYRGNQQPCT